MWRFEGWGTWDLRCWEELGGLSCVWVQQIPFGNDRKKSKGNGKDKSKDRGKGKGKGKYRGRSKHEGKDEGKTVWW